MERGSASRRQRSHKLEVLRAASALVDETLVGVEELFGIDVDFLFFFKKNIGSFLFCVISV